MSATDWSEFEPSPGKGRQAWIVVEEMEEGNVEALVYEDKDRPVMVEWVNYGPRGGVYWINNGGTIEGMRREIAQLSMLIRIAEKLEAMR